ncbi:PREDICTED: uncharacterized protein LOC104606128 isoform X2 [Nelumbo nucifera]|uniref:Uncharacterized protein LOC104606128 isoform X2 n=1 Tax=Nelumbo nucifera TaxID=4432 RepID=A0A1U8APG0_NELNU|nr:PREDICTED: uncharacterized protein LOC104606128 isoform X2 [Nelumbo nucifera]
MANSEPASLAVCSTVSPLTSKKENMTPIGSKISELNESRSELLSRIQGLKQDLQNWRSKLDTQVKIYRDELSELKKSLNVEVEQLRSQQEDVAANLRNLGLQDMSEVAKETKTPEAEENKAEEIPAPSEENSEGIQH